MIVVLVIDASPGWVNRCFSGPKKRPGVRVFENLPDSLGEIGGVRDLLFGVLRQRLTVPGSEFRAGGGGILGRVGASPLELEDKVVVPESLQLLHGPGGVVLVHERDEGETARLEGLLVLREVHAGDATEGLEEILQVGLRGVFRDVGDPDGVEVVHAALRLDAAGHRGPGRGRDVLSARGRASSGADDVPAAARGAVFLSFHAVLAFQLALLLLGPELVEVRREVLGGVLLLHVVVGERILDEDVVLGEDGRALGALGAVLEGVSEFLPLAAFLHGLGFPDLLRDHLDLGDGLEQLLRIRRVLTIRGDDLDPLRVDPRFVGRGDHQTAGRGGVGWLMLEVVFLVGIIIQDVSPALCHGRL
mmetsp:Transcript_12839/g.30325  ORF Transcript_12839/g.30325 Transcript_12839/m.30325 type:complete len:361 (+) Transcript_12839:1062-2144(+)